MTLASLGTTWLPVTQSGIHLIKGQLCHQTSTTELMPIYVNMMIGLSRRKERKKGEKMHECRGMLFENKEAFKTGSHACAKLGEGEVIVLIYTIMHVFCSVRNRPVLESQPHISHWRAFNSLAAWWMKQQRLQCSNGKDMGKETELS